MSKIKSKVLALKYRPQTFLDLIGQNVMVETITSSIKQKKVPNAYLFTGIRGVGKTTTARIVAKALNCEKGIENLCQDQMCGTCKGITDSNHMDILEMDAASKTGVDDIRDLIEFSRYGPSSAKYKIFIIDEVHMLSKQAFNALLKTLEEPPEYLKFIFATTEVRKIPVTVISRCQRFDLSRVKSETLFDYLKKIIAKEKSDISDEAVKLIVKISEGSVRDSLSLLDRALITQFLEKKTLDLQTTQKIFGYFDKANLIEIFDLIFLGNEAETLLKYRNISDQGIDPKIFLNDFLEILYFIKNFKIFGKNQINFSLNDTEIKEIQKISNKIDNETLILFWQFTIKSIEELNIVSNQNLSIEMFLIRLMHIKQIPSLENLLNNIEKDEIKNNNIVDKNFTQPIVKKNVQIRDVSESLKQIKNTVQEKKKEDISNIKMNLANKENILNLEEDSKDKNIKGIEELIDLCTKRKEFTLKHDLQKNVRLVKFENEHIEIEFNDRLDKDFIKNLSNKLFDWTNKRWIISLSKEEGKPTQNEIKQEIRKNKNKEIKNSLIFKKMIESFPDAELVDLED